MKNPHHSWKTTLAAGIFLAGMALLFPACSNNSSPSSPQPTATSTPAPTGASSATSTPDFTPTATFMATATHSSTSTSTPIATASSTSTSASTATVSATPSFTPTGPFTSTPSSTASFTSTPASTATPSSTPSSTPTGSFSPSPTSTPTASASPTPSSTATSTPTQGWSVFYAGTTIGAARGLALDSSSDLWVANEEGPSVLEFNPAGAVVTVFTGSATFGSFNSPWSVAIGPAGNLFVDDLTYVYKMNPTTGAGISEFTSAGGTALSDPWGVAVDSSGNVWVADALNNRVVEYLSNDYTKQNIYTSDPDGTSFDDPLGMGVDSSGDIYVSEETQVVEMDNGWKSVLGDFTSAAGVNFSDPYQVAVDSSGNIYIADHGNERVVELNSGGSSQAVFGSALGTAFMNPSGVALDKNTGYLYVSDELNQRILRYVP